MYVRAMILYACSLSVFEMPHFSLSPVTHIFCYYRHSPAPATPAPIAAEPAHEADAPSATEEEQAPAAAAVAAPKVAAKKKPRRED